MRSVISTGMVKCLIGVFVGGLLNLKQLGYEHLKNAARQGLTATVTTNNNIVTSIPCKGMTGMYYQLSVSVVLNCFYILPKVQHALNRIIRTVLLLSEIARNKLNLRSVSEV